MGEITINNEKSMVKKIVVISIILCVLGMVSPIIIKNISIEDLKLNEISGWIGDIMSPFLELSSITLLIATILLQREGIIAQQNELKLTKQDLDKQIKMIELQRFEGTFFNLLLFHNDFVKSMKLEIRTTSNTECKSISGKNGLEYLYNEFKMLYESKNIDHEYYDGSMMRDVRDEVKKSVKELYRKIYNENEDYMSRYFMSLYHIFKFIDRNNSIDDEEKKYYSSLVRAHLNNFEQALIFYNCNLEYGEKKFKPLVDKYDLIQNMNKKFLLNETHEWIYN